MATRISIMTVLHNSLGILATTAGLSAPTENYYGDSLNSAIRVLNNEDVGDGVNIPDNLNYSTLLELFENYTLRKMLNFYTFYVDTQVGPRKQQYSQLTQSIINRIKYPVISIPNVTYFDTFDRYNPGNSVRTNWFEVSDLDIWEF